MTRGEIFWASLGPPIGRRPVLIVTRTKALSFLTRITVAPISTTIRNIGSELIVGRSHGLPIRSAANCDSLMTILRDTFDDEPLGKLDARELRRLDDALTFALGIWRP